MLPTYVGRALSWVKNHCEPLSANSDIGPSTHLAFWPSVIQECQPEVPGPFWQRSCRRADKINFAKNDRLPATERRKIARSS